MDGAVGGVEGVIEATARGKKPSLSLSVQDFIVLNVSQMAVAGGPGE